MKRIWSELNLEIISDVTFHYGHLDKAEEQLVGCILEYDRNGGIVAIDGRELINIHGVWEFRDGKSL